MKGFQREDLMFSLCGLNCALCTMKIDNYCPGCGGGEGNQGCTIARCSLEHDGLDYCFMCSEYPCDKYNGIEEFDSFITHRHQLKDMEKVKNIGIGTYHTELSEKATILLYLLENYNDGRRKTLFGLAINLLELTNIKAVIQEIESKVSLSMTIKEKAIIAAKQFEDVALQKGIILKLNKKPSKGK
ncbi:MAG: DUF3795 domain-containing protein [Clostridiaceae bacterium]|nr:DUF3795 domain-containing protein [Clostridiaceae bacterium]